MATRCVSKSAVPGLGGVTTLVLLAIRGLRERVEVAHGPPSRHDSSGPWLEWVLDRGTVGLGARHADGCALEPRWIVTLLYSPQAPSRRATE